MIRKRWAVITGIILIVLVIGAGSYYRSQHQKPQYRTVAVTRGSVVQDVSFTGRVAAVRTAEVGFPLGGLIQLVAVHVGDAVKTGQVLTKVDPSTAQFDAAKATADLVSAEAQTKISADTATTSYEKTKTENARLIEEQKQKVRDAQASADGALSVYHTQADNEGEDSYLAKAAYSAYLTAKGTYNEAQQALTRLQKTVDKSNAAARATVQLAQEQHAATVQAAGSVAGLSSLAALQQRSNLALALYTIRAPFDGTVTHIDTEVGQYAAAGSSAITVATVSDLELKADVTETDTTKLAVTMPATVTFDALPNESWTTRITGIAPSATVIEGVPTYETTLHLDTTIEALRPGFTADITVHAKRQDNALAVPRRAIIEKDGNVFVRTVSDDGSLHEQPVRPGLIGSDGSIEITEGLTEGQHIVIGTANEQ